MTKTRRRNQQRRLHFVMLQTVSEFGQRKLDQRCGVRNESTQAPESGVQLANHSIALEFLQARQRNLYIHILLDESGIVTARGKQQVACVNLSRNLAESVIAIR